MPKNTEKGRQDAENSPSDLPTIPLVSSDGATSPLSFGGPAGGPPTVGITDPTGLMVTVPCVIGNLGTFHAADPADPKVPRDENGKPAIGFFSGVKLNVKQGGQFEVAEEGPSGSPRMVTKPTADPLASFVFSVKHHREDAERRREVKALQEQNIYVAPLPIEQERDDALAAARVLNKIAAASPRAGETEGTPVPGNQSAERAGADQRDLRAILAPQIESDRQTVIYP